MDAKWLATLNDLEINPAAVLEEAGKNQAVIQKQFIQLFKNFFSLIH
jgi:hypothetical protein